MLRMCKLCKSVKPKGNKKPRTFVQGFSLCV